MFTADGKFLGYNNNRSPERVLALLKKGLADYKPKKVDVKSDVKLEKRFDRTLPEGGLVIDVFSRILGDPYEKSDQLFDKIKAKSTGRDHLWLVKKDIESLVPKKDKYSVPENIIRRIVRFHLIDNTRGEPPMWQKEEVKAEMTITVIKKEGDQTELRLDGNVQLATSNNDRGYNAKLAGFITFKKDKITRFDIISKGDFWGEGTYTKGAPKGKFTLAVAFTLSDCTKEIDLVPPQGARDLNYYLGDN